MQTMAAPVHFRLDGIAETLAVAPPAGEQATFRAGEVEVVLEQQTTPDDSDSEDCLVVARVTREVDDETYGEFLRRLEIEADPPAPPESPTNINLDLFEWYFDPPVAVAALCESVYEELHGAASRLVQLLRWLFNRPWPAQPLGSAQLSWSLDGASWESAPSKPTEPAVFGDMGATLEPEGIEILERIWHDSRHSEPLARQIFLEAYALADPNPRAALVLAVAAAEIAVKQFAAAQSPRESEAWLISKQQSPPLLMLLRDYLPFFTDKRTVDGTAVPKHLRSTLHDAVEARNHIVHQGHSGYDEEQLADVFVAVNDLLYLLDWFAGHRWAFRHLQTNTKAAYHNDEGS
jgi:hypothetical protein